MNLLLLHPLPLDGSVWPPAMRALTGSVLAPTLYGLGDTIEQWAAAVLDAAEPGPIAIVGNSVGGSCAIEVARLAPERVHLLVLVGAKAGHRPEPRLRDEAVRVLDEEGIDAAWRRYWEPIFAPDADPAVVERGRRIAVAQGVDAVARGVCVFHGRPDRATFLRSFDGRVVIVRGEHDRIPKHAPELAAELRDGAFVAVAGAGHYVPLERPAQLAQIVDAALRGSR